MRVPTSEEEASWPKPNFESPEHLQAPVIAATSVAFTLAFLCECPEDVLPYQSNNGSNLAYAQLEES